MIIHLSQGPVGERVLTQVSAVCMTSGIPCASVVSSVPKMRRNGCFGRIASSVGAETREKLHFGLHSIECVPGKLCWLLKENNYDIDFLIEGTEFLLSSRSVS